MTFYDHFKITNDKKFSFSQEMPKGDIILEYMHTDQHRPQEIPLMDSASYILSIVDDYYKKLWVYILKSSDEAL